MEKDWIVKGSEGALRIQYHINIDFTGRLLSFFVVGFIINTEIGLPFEPSIQEIEFEMKPIYFWTNWLVWFQKRNNPRLVEMKTESNGREQ